MNTRGWWRLAVMMGLVYAVQGSFWPLLAVHLKDLGIDGHSKGWIFATLAIGSLAVPLGAGQLVDRLMATQRFLALAYALGTLLLAILASGLVVQGESLFLLFLAFWSIIAPSYGLCNSLAMRNLDDPRRDFGGVRLWGTIGWMVVGWLVSVVMACSGSARSGAGTYEAFLIATLVALAAALHCLTLPDTPPLAIGEHSRASWREGLNLVRQPEVAVLLVTSFGVCLTTPMVYQVMPSYLESRGLPRVWISTALTLGQWIEVGALATLPWSLRRIGYKGTLAVGIGAWFARFLSLAVHPPLWLAVSGSMLHGIGYGCFIVAAQIYLDSKAPSRHRASTQSLFLVLTSGLGSLLGSLLAGELAGMGIGDDDLMFLVPCVINGVLLIYFLAGFGSHVSTVGPAGAPEAGLSQRPHTMQGTVA
jgi:MFS family permease